MITNKVLLDTGPLVAMLQQTEQHHAICSQQALLIKGQVLTTWAVLTEAAWLLQKNPFAIRVLADAIVKRDIECVHLDLSALEWIAKQAEQYRSLKPQLADLSLLYLANQLKISHVFTLVTT